MYNKAHPLKLYIGGVLMNVCAYKTPITIKIQNIPITPKSFLMPLY